MYFQLTTGSHTQFVFKEIITTPPQKKIQMEDENY